MSTVEDDLAAIRTSARRYLADIATPEHLKDLLERPGSFDHKLWAGAVEQGWTALAAPEELGGLGLGWRGLCALAEELGSRTASLPLIANAVTVEALRSAADASALDRIAPGLIDGSRIACLAFAEPGEAGLPSQPSVSLRDGRLSGVKSSAAFAAVADLALLHAWDGQGAALVLLELNQAGVRREVQPTFDQSRAAARLHFDGAAAIRLDRAGDCGASIEQVLAFAALATAFEQIGGANACVSMARDYALERKVFGQVIGRFQAIKHKLAEMYYRTEIARGNALDALAALAEGDPAWRGLAAGARVASTDAYDFAAQENAQTHGAIGLTWEGMPHHHARRARSLALELGAKAFWRDRMLAELGFDDARHESYRGALHA
jgi:alkylation response protein AidB-like acyl-CoA dehydrogenase